MGHVVGALVGGGTVTNVVLHPATISRTDISPNPRPAIAVWSGPLVGCLLPVCLFAVIPRKTIVARKIAGVFAGFCLIANGAYITLGSWGGFGDSGEMLQTGTPHWVMIAFGAFSVPLGTFIWHRLGSIRRFWTEPSIVTPSMAYSITVLLVSVLVAEIAVFSK